MPIDPATSQVVPPTPRGGNPASSHDPSLAVAAMLAEYNMLRQESLASISNRVTIANFTFGAVSLILAALISQGTPGLLTGLLALVFVPQIAKVGLMIWLGEYNRSQRAGKWISELERKINVAVGSENAVAWETALLGNSIHMSYPYVSVVLLLLGVGWASVVFGVTTLAGLAHWHYTVAGWTTFAAVLAVLIANELWFIGFFRGKWREIKREYSKDGPPIWTV